MSKGDRGQTQYVEEDDAEYDREWFEMLGLTRTTQEEGLGLLEDDESWLQTGVNKDDFDLNQDNLNSNDLGAGMWNLDSSYSDKEFEEQIMAQRTDVNEYVEASVSSMMLRVEKGRWSVQSVSYNEPMKKVSLMLTETISDSHPYDDKMLLQEDRASSNFMKNVDDIFKEQSGLPIMCSANMGNLDALPEVEGETLSTAISLLSLHEVPVLQLSDDEFRTCMFNFNEAGAEDGSTNLNPSDSNDIYGCYPSTNHLPTSNSKDLLISLQSYVGETDSAPYSESRLKRSLSQPSPGIALSRCDEDSKGHFQSTENPRVEKRPLVNSIQNPGPTNTSVMTISPSAKRAKRYKLSSHSQEISLIAPAEPSAQSHISSTTKTEISSRLPSRSSINKRPRAPWSSPPDGSPFSKKAGLGLCCDGGVISGGAAFPSSDELQDLPARGNCLEVQACNNIKDHKTITAQPLSEAVMGLLALTRHDSSSSSSLSFDVKSEDNSTNGTIGKGMSTKGQANVSPFSSRCTSTSSDSVSSKSTTNSTIASIGCHTTGHSSSTSFSERMNIARNGASPGAMKSYTATITAGEGEKTTLSGDKFSINRPSSVSSFKPFEGSLGGEDKKSARAGLQQPEVLARNETCEIPQAATTWAARNSDSGLRSADETDGYLVQRDAVLQFQDKFDQEEKDLGGDSDQRLKESAAPAEGIDKEEEFQQKDFNLVLAAAQVVAALQHDENRTNTSKAVRADIDNWLEAEELECRGAVAPTSSTPGGTALMDINPIVSSATFTTNSILCVGDNAHGGYNPFHSHLTEASVNEKKIDSGEAPGLNQLISYADTDDRLCNTRGAAAERREHTERAVMAPPLHGPQSDHHQIHLSEEEHNLEQERGLCSLRTSSQYKRRRILKKGSLSVETPRNENASTVPNSVSQSHASYRFII